MRRRDLLLSSLALTVPAGGCGRPALDPVGDPAGEHAVLRLGLANPARNLDPRLATDATSERVNRLLYRRLTEFDARGLPVPGIADWERLSETRYRFRLRDQGRDFSDGAWLTARDVAATYRSILDPVTVSPHRTLLSLIRTIETPDSDTIDFTLVEPDPLFPAYLGIGILPAAGIAAGRPFTEAPLGSGPFRLIGRLQPGRLRIERRRDAQVVELVTVKDPSVRVMKLLRGEVQILQNDLSPELVDWVAARSGVRIETQPGTNCSYLGFNLDDPVTGDMRIRQAIAHGIDREALLRHLFHDRARPAEGLLVPEHWAGHPGLAPHRHDPALARALLAQAGFGPDRPLGLTLKTSADPFRVRLATVIQSQLAAVGIRLSVRSFDWGTFFGDVKSGRFQLYALTWVGIRTPDIFRYAFHSAAVPPDGANRGRYRSPAADALIAEARAQPELADQAPLYRDLQALLHGDLPALPLWFEDQVLARRNEVRDYRLAADGNYDGLGKVTLGARA